MVQTLARWLQNHKHYMILLQILWVEKLSWKYLIEVTLRLGDTMVLCTNVNSKLSHHSDFAESLQQDSV